MLQTTLFILGGFAVLILGASFIIRGSSSLALRFKISPLIIGLTVVAYGTSMPELFVSSLAAYNSQGGIATGIIIGSNIFNICVILALSAVICPLKVNSQIIRLDIPVLILASAVILIMLANNHLSRVEAGLLVLGIIVYTMYNLHEADRRTYYDVLSKEEEGTISQPTKNVWYDVVYIISGILLLATGSHFLLKGAVEIAHYLDTSEAIIGLTILAGGTSISVLATSFMAALKKQSDIAVGNIIGSSIFNLFGILGIAGLIRPIESVGVELTDLWFMVGSSLLVLPFIISDRTLKRWGGLTLFCIYLLYLWVMWP